VDSSRTSSRDPIQITAETVHANNPWKKLQLAARFAPLEKKLTGGGALPIRLIDLVDSWKAFL